eukprot:jgi/Psemu1/41422/gm1.41422_g
MVQTIPNLNTTAPAASAPRTRSSSAAKDLTTSSRTTRRSSMNATTTTATTTTHRRFEEETSSPPPSGSPISTSGKRKKRARRTLPLSAPAIAAPPPTVNLAVDALLSLAGAPPLIPTAAVLAPPTITDPAPAPSAPAPFIPDAVVLPLNSDPAIDPSTTTLPPTTDDLVPTVSYDEEEEEQEIDGEVDTAVAAAAAGVTVTDFHLPSDKKRNKAINDPSNPLDPFNNLEHFVWCAMENIMTEWALRGCLEPSSIVKEDFETGVFTEGEFKKRSLSLKNPVLDDRNTKKTTLPCPYNGDPMSTYQTTIKLLSLVPDNCEGVNRIFRKPASKKQLEASAIWKKQGRRWRLNPSANQVIGKNRINEILVLIATWSGYENPERCTAHDKRHESISKVANAGVSASLVKGLGGHAHLNTTTNYILPDQQAVDGAVRAKHGSPSKIRVPLPAPAQARPAHALPPTSAPLPAPPSPATSVHDFPTVSVHHSFGDHSNDSVPSDCAAGNLGLMTQTFEVPNESPPPMSSNISFTTGEEPSPVPLPFTDRRRDYHDEVIPRSTPRPKTHYKGRGMFAEDRPQYEDHHHCEPRYNRPPAHRYEDRCGSRYDDKDRRCEEPLRPPHTQSYEPRYERVACQEPRRLSFGETLSYKPQYEERKPPPRYQESKPPPSYEERKPPPRYEERKPSPPRYDKCKPPPRRHSYEQRTPPPRRHSYEQRKPPPRPPSTNTPSYEQRPSLAERGSRQRPPPHQDQRRVSFGSNRYYRMEDYGAWGPTPVEVFSHSTHRPRYGREFFQSNDPEVQITEVHRPSAWEDVELPEWGSQIRW